MSSSKTGTNIAFIILIVFLTIAASKNMNGFNMAGFNFADLPSSFGNNTTEEVVDNGPKVMNEFENMRDVKTNKKIDLQTAKKYVDYRSLNGTEILEIQKVASLNKHYNGNKKIVIYTTNSNNPDMQRFLSEFAKTRKNFGSKKEFVFVSHESAWPGLSKVENSHDRVILNLKNDCKNFCIIDSAKNEFIKLKGSNANKKSAEIIDVILNAL